MAARTTPIDPEFPDRGDWHELVQDHRYRLFASGYRRAAIAECLAPQSETAAPGDRRPVPPSFDGRYGLRADAQKRLVLLTQVSRVANASAERRPWRWVASHSVQPVARLKSYIDEQAGTLVFFLTRSSGNGDSSAAARRERLEESALRIGRSLGLAEDNLEALRVAGLVHEIGRTSPLQAASGKFSVMGGGDTQGGESCRFPGCGAALTARLEEEPYCVQHFISTCYARLDKCCEQLGGRRSSERIPEDMRAFLQACIEEATTLTRDPFHQNALERARLLDILYTASDLSGRMRRGPRRSESIAVRLLCQTRGRPWEEVIHTKKVSQYGAMLECQHLVKPEDWLSIERVDTGRRVRARLAWRGPAPGGQFSVGLEFLDADNFWGLSWHDK